MVPCYWSPHVVYLLSPCYNTNTLYLPMEHGEGSMHQKPIGLLEITTSIKFIDKINIIIRLITFVVKVSFLHIMDDIFFIIIRRFTLVLIERCRKATTNSYNILQPSYPHQPECQVSKALMKVVPRRGVEKTILVEHISTLFFLQRRWKPQRFSKFL